MRSRKLTDKVMARFWNDRLAELRSMRPMTPEEALAAAAIEDQLAEDCKETMRIAKEDEAALYQSPMPMGVRASSLAAIRAGVWGEETRRLQHLQRADSLRKIAREPLGVPLAESIAEAQQRAEHYQRLADKSNAPV